MPEPVELALSASDIARRLCAQQTSSVEEVLAAHDRIVRWQPQLNCLLEHRQEQGIAEAQEADKAMARGRRLGLLHGVPLAHKDIFDFGGRPPSRGYFKWRPPDGRADACVLERLSCAGAVNIGRLNLSEWGYNPYGLNFRFGHCHNPYNPTYVAGGSSSGSAAAVAAGIIPASLGSDTGGSVRIPAALCGCIGLLPTANQVNLKGVARLTRSLDNIGILSRSIDDTKRIMKVIAERPKSSVTMDPLQLQGDTLGERLRTSRIGVMHSDMRAVHRAADILSNVGCSVTRMEYDLEELAEVGDVVELYELKKSFSWALRRIHELQPILAFRLQHSLAITYHAYIQAMKARQRLIKHWLHHIFNKYDALLLPTIDNKDCRLRTILARLKKDMWTIDYFGYYTQPFNVLGLPAIHIPLGRCDSGLPDGFQLVAKPFNEDVLLALGDTVLNRTE